MADTNNRPNEKGLMLIEWLIVLAIIGILIGAPILSAYICKVSWADSGMRSKWGIASGCRVSKDGKNWIPEESYREIGND